MNITRKLKLEKLTGINYLSEKEKKMLNFVNSKILNLSEFRITEKPHNIYYMNKNGKFVCSHNSVAGYLFVRNDFEYFNFTQENHISYDYLGYFIEYLMEITYKINIEFASIETMHMSHIVESEYKSRQQ